MKNKKIFIGVGVIVLALVGVMWIARPDASDSSVDSLYTGSINPSYTDSGSVILSEAPSFDFGTVSMAEGVVTHVFTIKNPTANPVTITRLYTSCMCTSVALVTENGRKGPFGMAGHGFIPKFKEVLEPGGRAVVQVAFDPAAHGPAGIGLAERTVYVETADVPPFELHITAVVTP